MSVLTLILTVPCWFMMSNWTPGKKQQTEHHISRKQTFIPTYSFWNNNCADLQTKHEKSYNYDIPHCNSQHEGT